MIVLPLRVGTFFISRSDTSLKDSAVDKISSISSLSSSSMPNRSFLLSLTPLHPFLKVFKFHHIPLGFNQLDFYNFFACSRCNGAHSSLYNYLIRAVCFF